MNKLILVGNGFDLAHGLPTSYGDFINDFWENIHLNYKKSEYKKLVYIDENYHRILNYKKQAEGFKDFEENLISYQNEYSNELEGYNNSTLKLRNSIKIVFKFENNFFENINKKQSIENWVDIENEYYLELKKITKLKFGNYQGEELQKARKKKLLKLNEEFSDVKELLRIYLLSKVNNAYDFNSSKPIGEFQSLLNIFNSNNFFQNYKEYDGEVDKYSFEFSSIEDKNEILKIKEDLRGSRELISFNTLLLDFNYTRTGKFYNNFLSDLISENSIVKIHGDLNDPIFGFGDETDDDYKLIENINDNEYLKFFKSFQYSLNGAYDKLLQFIDFSKFQVLVLGHSCGLSDRIMLNTIFEHENCRSIKIYYHQKEDGSDNYLDVVKNISRHFNDKPSMRRKIVSKELSSPLPQNVRFEKIEKKQ
jgi:hypothetical protein